jgi:hypothetical protein
MPKKTERPGILSLHERELIQRIDKIRSGEIKNKGRAPSRLAELLPDFDKRLSALTKDLELFVESRALRPFLKYRRKQFSLVLTQNQQLQKLLMDDDYSTWRVRYATREGEKWRRYWLYVSEENAPNGLTLENIYDPEYALKGIEGYSVNTDDDRFNVRDLLKFVVKHDMNQKKQKFILPRSEDNAITIYHIIQKMRALEEAAKKPKIERGKTEEKPGEEQPDPELLKARQVYLAVGKIVDSLNDELVKNGLSGIRVKIDAMTMPK